MFTGQRSLVISLFFLLYFSFGIILADSCSKNVNETELCDELSSQLIEAIKKDSLADVANIFASKRLPDSSLWILQFIVNRPDSEGYRPLHYAKSTEMVALLVSHGSDINKPTNNINKHTPLMRAIIEHKSAKFIEFMLHLGANPNIRCLDLETALHYACNWLDDESEAKIDLLIQAGADINTQNRIGLTPLHYAVHSCCAVCCNHTQNSIIHENVAKKLLSDNRVLIDRDSSWGTPLFIAAQDSTRIDIVKLLLAKGANPCYKLSPLPGRSGGQTPQQIAQVRGNKEIAILLVQAEENRNVKHNEDCE